MKPAAIILRRSAPREPGMGKLVIKQFELEIPDHQSNKFPIPEQNETEI